MLLSTVLVLPIPASPNILRFYISHRRTYTFRVLNFSNEVSDSAAEKAVLLKKTPKLSDFYSSIKML